MKPFPLIRFVPKPLRLTQLFRRQAKPAAGPPPAMPAELPPDPVRFTPVWFGGQVLPFIIDTRNRDRRRDLYDSD
jgi:hypothetical protein